MPSPRPFETGFAGGTVPFEERLRSQIAYPPCRRDGIPGFTNDAVIAIFGIDRHSLSSGIEARFPL